MSVEYDENGVEHIYAPNPKMQGEDWSKEYPPIKTNSMWLVNKYTGEIFPNTVEFARRSDILEPYLGELPRDGISEGATVAQVNAVLKPEAPSPQDNGELESL